MAGFPGDTENYSGDLRVAAPAGGVTRGRIYQIATSGKFAMARETAAAAAQCLFALDGAMVASKDTSASSAIVAGGRVFVITASGLITGNATGNTLVGYALEAQPDAGTQCRIVLTGLGPTQS